MRAHEAEPRLLLDLLREAGDEAVTLDELEVAGVREPALALLELEEAGHAVSRVFDTTARGRLVTCVRLGEAGPAPAPAGVAQAPTPEVAARRASGAAAPTARPPRPLVLAGLLAALLLALLASR
jgi:hypothetical protein